MESGDVCLMSQMLFFLESKINIVSIVYVGVNESLCVLWRQIFQKQTKKIYFKRGMDGASTLDPPFHLFIFIYQSIHVLILYLCEEETDGIERNPGLANNQRD